LKTVLISLYLKNNEEEKKMSETIEYKNPTPVSVLLVPVNEAKSYELSKDIGYMKINTTKLLYICRAIEPRKGMMAMPGGFVDELESVETSGKRELEEETGLVIEEEDIKLYGSKITPRNQILIFCTTPDYDKTVLNQVKLNKEVSGFVISGIKDIDFAFPLHKEMAGKFLNEINSKNIINDAMYRIFSSEEKSNLIEKMKADGLFTDEFTLERLNKKRNRNKF
jgi:ADP-ribose pyrophosphatase YjhB (NUDIX family)